MRLQTEAFDHLPIPVWAIVIPLFMVLLLLAALYYVLETDPTANPVFLYAALLLNLAVFGVNVIANLGGGVDPDQLSADLKSQLGIEKVSYDDDYRELTGEKDDTVVFCVLAEEGEKGNIYEVICK